MEKIVCKICGKVIEGYSDRHVSYLLDQHKLTHKYDNRKLKHFEEIK